MPPTLKKASSLDEVYKQFNGDVNLFLKSKQHTNDESLVLQVKKELSQKGLLEIKMYNDQKELWTTWFNLKNSKISEMEKQAEKAAYMAYKAKEKKSQELLYKESLDAYQYITRAQNSLNPPFLKAALEEEKKFDPKKCTVSLADLVKENVLTQEFVDKLLTKNAQGDKQAAKNIGYLTNGTVWNINKNQFQKTGMADETTKNQEDFHNFNNSPNLSAGEKNKTTQRVFTIRRVVFQCNEENPSGNAPSAEARNINNIIQRANLMSELKEKTKGRSLDA